MLLFILLVFSCLYSFTIILFHFYIFWLTSKSRTSRTLTVSRLFIFNQHPKVFTIKTKEREKATAWDLHRVLCPSDMSLGGNAGVCDNIAFHFALLIFCHFFFSWLSSLSYCIRGDANFLLVFCWCQNEPREKIKQKWIKKEIWTEKQNRAEEQKSLRNIRTRLIDMIGKKRWVNR